MPSAFQKRLKAWRKKNGWTQPLAATALDVPLPTYRRWEQGVSQPPARLKKLIDSMLT